MSAGFVQWYIICAGGYYSLSMKKIEKNDTMSCIKFKIRTRRCSLSYILLMCRTHFHDRHISLSGVVYTHKTSLTPPRLPVASHESERSRVLRVSNVTCIYFAFVEFSFRRYIINIKLIKYKIATTPKHYRFSIPNRFIKPFYFKVLFNGIVSMYIDVQNIAMYTFDNGGTHIHVL
jgi:hypothetical protein